MFALGLTRKVFLEIDVSRGDEVDVFHRSGATSE